MTREGRHGENLRDEDKRWPPAGRGTQPDGYGTDAAPEGGDAPPDPYGPPGYPGQPPEPGYGSHPGQGAYPGPGGYPGQGSHPGQGGYPGYGSQPGWAGQQGGSHPGAADPYSGPQDPYSIPDPYAPQDRYPARDPYGSRDAAPPPDPYLRPDPYGPPAPGSSGDPYAGPDPYRTPPPYAGPDPYAPPGSASPPGQDRPARAGGYGPRDPFGGRDPLDTSVPFVPESYGDQPQHPGGPGGQRGAYGDPGPYGPPGGPDPYGQADPQGGRDPYGQTDPSGGRAAYGRTDPGGRDPYRGAGPPPQHPGDAYGTADPYRPADPYGSTAQYQQPPDFGGYYPGGPDQPPDSRPQAAVPPGHDPLSFPGAGHGPAGAGQQGTDQATDPAGRPGGPFRWMPPAGLPGPGDDSPDYLRGQGTAGNPAADYGPPGYGPPGYSPPGYGPPGSPEPLLRPPGYEEEAAAPGEPYPAWQAGRDAGNGMGYGGDPRYAADGGPPYPAGGDPDYPGAGDPRYLAPGTAGPGPAPGRGPGQGAARDQARGPGGGPAKATGKGGRPGRNMARGPAGGAGRPPKKRRSGTFAGLAAAIVIIVVLAAGGIAGYRYIQGKLHPANYAGAGQGTVLVQVQAGDSAITLAPRLQRLGVIASTAAFVAAAKASSDPAGLEPGTFRLHKHMNAALAYQLLLNPKSRVQAKVVIREGLRVSQVVAALAGNTRFKPVAYSEALRDATALGLPSFANGNPEGYLFPATYTIQPNETPQQILQAMTARFRQEAQSINLPTAAKAAMLSQSHVIIVASLIQAEAGQVSDFPKIARVIYNRLNTGMKLELDSTVFYALGKYGIMATSADLKTNSPYNTYRHAGLPPTPIDSPGDAAIKAALHPAHGDWLYFVTVDPKKHITKFTASETQFEQFRAELARNLKANR